MKSVELTLKIAESIMKTSNFSGQKLGFGLDHRRAGVDLRRPAHELKARAGKLNNFFEDMVECVL
jgi:hypothetical protein